MVLIFRDFGRIDCCYCTELLFFHESAVKRLPSFQVFGGKDNKEVVHVMQEDGKTD